MNNKLLAVAAGVIGIALTVGSSTFGATGNMHVACSADGSHIVAVFENGGISTSVDAGKTWSQRNAPQGYWLGVASSADGSKLVAAIDGGGVYTSADSGTTWTSNAVPVLSWTALGSSEDGIKLVAVAASGAIYTSTNSGSVWMPRNVPNLPWTSVASSADGSKLAVVWAGSQYGGGIYTSIDSGGTWISNSFLVNTNSGAFQSTIAISADGCRVVLSALGAGIYISTNFGTNWSTTSAGATWWEGVASSADGLTLAAAAVNAIYVSTNSGSSWTPVSSSGGDYFQVAASADCGVLIGANWFGDTVDVLRLSPTPVLKIAPSSNNAVLSWIVPSISLELQQSADLNSTNWTDVGSPLTLTNLQYQTIVPTATNQMFFRLAPQ